MPTTKKKAKEATYDENCWCKPTITQKGGYTIITHKHPDGTLIYQRELPSIKVRDDWKPVFGKHLTERRNQLGLTQTQVGRRAGITATSLGIIEKGRAGISLPALVKLARALDTTIDELTAGILKDE